ncbi:hypothetical protein CSB93_2061 [Pseudomonas paraeruginosa]|uniref:Uncharacterized protein n=1 Tax=Pseudomonas paraeruginosa TaxID=2994495 RepID=A0A2R3IMV8_9PSED|nr:hypothetical protein CSB93_2061 [Pseudomonas paraeruginosa]AWE89986.1 hypothetical protein CSC28_0827 [Pseudomonas paraeruginosa]
MVGHGRLLVRWETGGEHSGWRAREAAGGFLPSGHRPRHEISE